MKYAPFITEIGLFPALAAALAPAVASAAWLDGFGYRRRIEVDCAKVDAPLTNFPARVRLTTDNFDFAKARTNGFDLRFATVDGQTLLAYERERHDAVAQAAEYWVRLPLVADDSNTVFYMYCGCPSAPDGADAANVWDVHFVGVWHKNDLTTSSIKDSTTNANNAAKRAANEPVEADGTIGKAQAYDGADDHIRATNRISLNPGTASFSIAYWTWVNSTAGTSGTTIWDLQVAKRSGGANGYYVGSNRSEGPANQTGVRFMLGNTSSQRTDTPFVFLNFNEWFFVAAVLDRAANQQKISVNAGSWSATTPASGSISNSTDLGIGWDIDQNNFWHAGRIDEVRVSNTARSDAWIKAEYHSGAGDLLIYGDEQRHSGFFNPEFF